MVDVHNVSAAHEVIQRPGGKAVGASFAWLGGQYCAIHAAKGVVGCGVYDIACADHFNMAFAIARGTPELPLRKPKDLLAAKIVQVSRLAAQYGVEVGMTGGEALDRLLGE